MLKIEGVTQAALIEEQKKIHLFSAVDEWTQELRDAIRPILEEHRLVDIPLLKCSALPVDGRHNSKIDRPLLRRWLSRCYVFSSPPFERVLL